MATIFYSAIVRSISGKLSGSVFARGNASLRRLNPHPHNPASQKQQIARGRFSNLCGAWYALTDTQKELWHTYAAMAPGKGSGFNAFVATNMKLLSADSDDLTQINFPPVLPSTAPSITGFTAERWTTYTRVEWDTPNSPDVYVQVYFSVPIGYNLSTEYVWQFLATVRSDIGFYLHGHDYPQDVILVYQIRVIDSDGNVSPPTDPLPLNPYQYIPILVDNISNPNTLTDYQITLTIPANSDVYTNSQQDGGNLRFLDADKETLLPFWIESWNYQGDSVFWIRVPSIPASSTKNIYAYLLDPTQTSTSSKENTFYFYDDFPGVTLDTDKWDEDAVGDITHTVNNYFRFLDGTKSGNTWWIGWTLSSGNQHQSKWTPCDNFLLEWTSLIADTSASQMGQGFVGVLDTNDDFIMTAGHNDSWDSYIHCRRSALDDAGGGASVDVNPMDSRFITLSRSGNDYIVKMNGVLFHQHTTTKTIAKIALMCGAYGPYPWLPYIQVSNLLVRGYADPEPIATTTTTTYPYSHTVQIDNTANPNTLTNYPVKLTIPADSPVYDYAQGNGGNVRFYDTNGTTLLTYWKETWVPGEVSTFWIKIPSIPASDTKDISLKIIRPNVASTSNGNGTFSAFGGFQDTPIGDPPNPAQIWTEGTNWYNTIDIQTDPAGTNVHTMRIIESGDSIVTRANSNLSPTQPYAFHVWLYRGGSERGYFRLYEGGLERVLVRQYKNPDSRFQYHDGATWQEFTPQTPNCPQSTWCELEFRVTTSSMVLLFDGSTYTGGFSSAISVGCDRVSVSPLSTVSHQRWFRDWFVRPYSSPDPTATL